MGVHFRVRELTESKGWSRYKLHKVSGIDERVLRKIWQDGDAASINTSTLGRLADALEVDVSELIESDPPRRRS